MNKTGLCLALVLFLTGCGADKAIKSTNSMPEKMDRMLKEMSDTSCTLKRGISFEALLKEEFGKNLIPVPFDLMPFAREFAKCASEEDLAEVAYVWMKKLNEVTLEGASPTPEQVAAFNHERLHVYSALASVAGFIPRAKLDRIIHEQIVNDGVYQDSVLELLMLRAQFIRDVRLENGLFSKGLINVGRVEQAVEFAEELEHLARLPFVDQVGVTITGFIDPYPDVIEAFNKDEAVKMWKKIKLKAERMNVEMKTWTGQPNEDAALFAKRQERMNSALSKINSRINGWTGRP